MSDEHLLRAWAERADEEAFRSLVARYSGLVHGAALRRVGDAGLAEEITQDVFARLSRSAGRLAAHPTLAGWLHRSTMLLALERLRRRAAQERKVARLCDMNSNSRHREPLADALPILDEAIDQLHSHDREVLMLHFAERLTFPQIAARVGSTPDAVRMRSSRALAALSALLRKKGVMIPAAMLAAGLGSTLAQVAPASLVVAPLAVAGAGKVSGLTFFVHAFQTMKVAKAGVFATLVVLAAFPIIFQQQQIAAAEARVAALRSESVAQVVPEVAVDVTSGTPSVRGDMRGVDLKQLGEFALEHGYGSYQGTRRLQQVTARLDVNNLSGLIETVMHSGMLPAAREALLGALLDELRRRDVAPFLEWTGKVLENPPPVRSRRYSNYSAGLRFSAERAFRVWVSENPVEAERWAANHEAEWAKLRATPFAALAAAELLEADPVRALPSLEKLPLGHALTAMSYALRMQPEKAEEFAIGATRLKEPERRQKLIRAALQSFEVPEGVSRMEFAGRVLDGLDLTADDRLWIATRLALDCAPSILKDPNKASTEQVEWAEKYVPAERLSYAKGALGHLYQPRHALVVLNAALDEVHDDQMIAGYVESDDMQYHQGGFEIAGGYHGDTAFRLATRVRDDALRARLLAKAWTDLNRSSPDAARKLLSIPELSEGDRAALDRAIATPKKP